MYPSLQFSESNIPGLTFSSARYCFDSGTGKYIKIYDRYSTSNREIMILLHMQSKITYPHSIPIHDHWHFQLLQERRRVLVCWKCSPLLLQGNHMCLLEQLNTNNCNINYLFSQHFTNSPRQYVVQVIILNIHKVPIYLLQ